MHCEVPLFSSDDALIDDAFRIAIGDTISNIGLMKKGLLATHSPLLYAGLNYKESWTRDAAINVWNGTPLFLPDVSHNTLLSVLTKTDGRATIGGELQQYWDAIIWSCGAWQYYLLRGDKEFLRLALEAVTHWLAWCEATEFDETLNLFRGPACYGDGISSYPDIYVKGADGAGYIKRWPKNFPELAAKKGFGLPMHALSTNCLYQHAYVLAGKMAAELGVPVDSSWARKAEAMRDAINRHFWMPEHGHYRYLIDPFGGSDVQEGLGVSFALLFGVADRGKAASLLAHQYVSRWGIPCLWPPYERYSRRGKYGHHSGLVWPHIQPFWGEGALLHGRDDIFMHEFMAVATLAKKNGQYREIFNPDTGKPDTGEQEGFLSVSCQRQTWCATGFLRMVLMGLFGMQFSPEGITFKPLMPASSATLSIDNLVYRQMRLSLRVTGKGSGIRTFTVNGIRREQAFLEADLSGEQSVEIELG